MLAGAAFPGAPAIPAVRAMKALPVGKINVERFPSDDGHSAAAIGNTGVRVVSTTAVIAMLEECCHRLLKEHFEPGEASVGTLVDVEHLRPTPLGGEIETRAEVEAVERRKVTFAVSAEHDGKTIMRGRHERAVVELARFLEAVEGAGP